MKVRFYEIEWDTSTDDEEMATIEPPSLPLETVLEVDDDTDLEDNGADVLSDKYGFCVFSFEFEVIR